jgi:hypothetical protein
MESEKATLFLNRKIFNDLNKELITENHINQINNILNVYDNKSIKNRLKNICDFIKYDVDGDWVERLSIIQNILKNDVMSDYAIEIRYGKNNLDKIKKDLANKVSHTKEKYIEKFGEEDGLKKWEDFKLKSKTPWGLKACIEKFGEELGPKKWEERLSKKVNTMKDKKKETSYRNGRTLSEYQDRYGKEEGYNKWFERNKNHSYRFSKEYYIEKFGEYIGLREWEKYKSSMNKTSKKSFIKKYGIEIGSQKYEEFTHKQVVRLKTNPRYSKISQELFWYVYNKLDNKTDNIYFAELNEEYMFFPWLNDLNIIEVDFKHGNKIIEFDGDYWHSKPEQIEKDILRDKYLISKGYNILRVKESDYKNDKEKIINECLMFLKG